MEDDNTSDEKSELRTSEETSTAGDLPIEDIAPEDAAAEPEILFDLTLLVDERGIQCQFACLGHEARWSLPKTVVRRAHKALTIDNLFDILGAGPIVGCYLHNAETNAPDYQMVPRAVNALTERVTKELRLALKKAAAAARDIEPST